MNSETADAFSESLIATGILTVNAAQAAGLSTGGISKDVVLLNSFNDSPPAVPCTPSGQIRFQMRYSGAIRTDDSSDHVEASGTITYENCVVNLAGIGNVTVNGTLSITGLFGKQPSGRETIRQSGSVTWTRDSDKATGGCSPDWTTTLVLPNMRQWPAILGQFCGPDIPATLSYVTTYMQNRRAALTAAPPGLLPPPGGPADAVGAWAGTINANNPCSVGNPIGHYPWTGRLERNGNTFTMTWRDAYFETQMVRQFPTNAEFTFTINDQFDSFTLTGRFASDYKTFSGDVTGHVDCVTSVRAVGGTMDGHRTGP